MKLSEQWLRTWVNPDWSTETLAEALSLAGLEVDDIEPVAPAFSGVVVAEVKQVEKHPDADKLNITQVDTGSGELIQIVCGAPNVKVGIKVPCALVGAVLPGDFKIKKAKLRGVASTGMLCSGSELGLEQDYDGLMLLPDSAPVGVDIREYLSLNDVMIDVDLTPNRADCLSLEGLAREVALVSGAPLGVGYETKQVATSDICTQAVRVAEPQACPKYLGCIVDDFDATANTPDWMVQRLERSGVRSISLVVDITNYVLLELGQPMHAFDADKLCGSIEVRYAGVSEKLVTLDEKELQLTPQTLIIADNSGPIALAGIMGGLTTSVTDATCRLFFECAHFSPLAIVGKARQYGLHTDSSHRFERGVDPMLPERALQRALALLTDIAGGKVSEWVSMVDYNEITEPVGILLRRSRLHRLLGAKIDDHFVTDVLVRLGCTVLDVDSGWQVTAPSYRFDIQIEVDLIEEVARIYGYNNLPDTQVAMPLSLKPLPESEQDTQMLRQAMLQRGFHEVITYSFVEESALKNLSPEIPYVLLQNPISEDMSAMRTSLFPGLLQTLSYNQNRQQTRVRIFETGLIFSLESKKILQTPVIGGLIAGSVAPLGWSDDSRKVDFYDLKGDVENLLAMSHLHGRVDFMPTQSPEFHPGQCAALMLDDQHIGIMGQLHPQWLKPFAVSGPVFMFQIFMDSLLTMQVPKVTGISKFPEVQRDLAFVVEQSISVMQIVECIKQVDNLLLQDVQVFDIYQGAGVAETHKSVALGLRIQHHDRTLQDQEVDALIDRIVQTMTQELEAKLR